MRFDSAVLSLIGVIALTACGDMVIPADDAGGAPPVQDNEPNPAGEPDPTDAGADAPADAVAMRRADASTLELASLTPSTSRLTEGESVTFSASVNDPYGASDITRGALSDDQGNFYGNLTSSGSWTFRLTLAWADLHRIRPIDFAPPGARRRFVATFTNRQGQTASASVDVDLHCAPDDHVASCHGACTSLWTPDNCGGCGVTCAAPRSCDRGTCR